MKLLINIALDDDRLSDAEQLVEQLPEDQRATAELNLGGAMWTRYLRMNANDSAKNDAQAANWKQRAGELLWTGFQGLANRGSVATSEAAEVLYLVQFLLDQCDFDRAIEVLEDSSAGPLAYVRDDSSHELPPGFARETYKAGLRAYLSVDPPKQDEAQQMMEELENAIRSQANAEQELTNFYVNLGLQLQNQINAFTTTGESDKASTLRASFENLLSHVNKRGGAGNWQVQNWIAQTNLQLGEGLQGKEAAVYLQQAEEAYRDILVEVEKRPDYAPSELAVLAVRKRLGDCLLAQRKFESAFAQYTQILAKQPNMLELQTATARVLHEWGRETKNVERIEQAILGALPQEDKKNLVWGWLQLAKIANTARKRVELSTGQQSVDEEQMDRYQDLFFKARFYAAKARFEAAQLTPSVEGREQMQTARQSVESMKRLYPDLGGSKWKKAFDELLQQIEAQLQSK